MTLFRSALRAPGPRGHAVTGSLDELRDDPLGLLAGAARDHGDVVRLRLGQEVHLVNHPDHFRHVLQDNHRNYPKGFGYDRLEPLIGKGLPSAEGELGRRPCNLAQPAYHRQRNHGFAQLMARHTEALLARWDALPAGSTLDIHAEMMRLAFAIIGDALFSIDLRRDARAAGRAFNEALEILDDRFQSMAAAPSWLPASQDRRLRAAVAVIDRLIGGVVDERRRSGVERRDLLGMLMAARDEETGERMDGGQLRDELVTLVLGGHETTANTLTWLWYLLAGNPSAERRLHDELARTLDGRAPALEDLPALQLTTMTIEETLRLYPPVWLFGRRAVHEDTLGGWRIPAGGTLFLSPYVAHRDPRFWPDPARFDPQRFLPEAVAARPRFTYFPFALGPRRCIGAAFAMMQLQIVVAMIASRYRLQLAPGQVVEPDPQITLRPRRGLPMTLRPRQAQPLEQAMEEAACA